MYISKLHILNFIGFEEKEIIFNSKFTCAIGENGMGKSSLLYAMQVALDGYLQCLHLPKVKDSKIKSEEKFFKWNDALKDDLPNRGKTAITVFSEFDEYGMVNWSTVLPGRGKKVQAIGDKTTPQPVLPMRGLVEPTLPNFNVAYPELKIGKLQPLRNDRQDLINMVARMLEVRSSKPVLLPVIASFGTDRLNSQIRKGKIAQERRSRLEKGYLAALEDKVDFNGVIEWLHNYDSELKYNKEFEGTREAVFEAISTAIPYLEDVNYNSYYRELEAFVNIDAHNQGKKTHSNMSDGLISMLNLVAEIAFRCVMLNGQFGKNAIKQSNGIVMIDELDMHLHPNWQRHIVQDLKNAFPGIQFVVTTHSPFIVQSLHLGELLILDDQIQKDGDPVKKGIEDVAADEMGVDDIPRSIAFLEMQKTAEDYFNLIALGKKSESDAKTAQLRNKLNELELKFSDDPAFVALLKLERKSNGL